MPTIDADAHVSEHSEPSLSPNNLLSARSTDPAEQVQEFAAGLGSVS